MEELIMYVLIFLLSLISYYLFILRSDKKIEKYKKSSEIVYLVSKYKIDLKKVNAKKLSILLAVTNSFIFATTVLISSLFSAWVLKVFVGLSVLIPLILIFYHLIGTHYNKE